ncbi:hypothetical protein BGI50_15910 [Burkholderia pseudomallei]|nr:hypothetical protein BGI50_15910 [Burkholderia pseudomallei]KKI74778.1 hypothetical protein VU09_15915 [Burkholderia pseudomallei]OMO13785.1 hypothetical protein BGI48_15955 [Burkholderia pseudomallei]
MTAVKRRSNGNVLHLMASVNRHLATAAIKTAARSDIEVMPVILNLMDVTAPKSKTRQGSH